MKSIEARFAEVKEMNPNYSSYVCFATAIMGQGFTHDMIVRWFRKFVDIDDYDKKGKIDLLNYLTTLSMPENSPRTTKIGHKTVLSACLDRLIDNHSFRLTEPKISDIDDYALLQF